MNTLLTFIVFLSLVGRNPQPPTPVGVTVTYSDGSTVQLTEFSVLDVQEFEDDSVVIIGCKVGGYCVNPVPHRTYIVNNHKVVITPLEQPTP